MSRRPGDFDGYLFDLDGCVYEGSSPTPSAAALIAFLARKGKKVAFLSNNSSEGADEVAAKLKGMGIDADPEDVSLPTDLAGEFLLESFGRVSVFPIGNGRVAEAIRSSGHRIAGNGDESCDVVFVARDSEFSYAKLERAARFLSGGARLAAANPDDYHIGDAGARVPETGAILASVRSASGKEAAVLGKPESFLFRRALAALGLGPERVLMIGDNPATDIAGAAKAGLASVWIDRADEKRGFGAGAAGIECPCIRAYRDLSEFLGDLEGNHAE